MTMREYRKQQKAKAARYDALCLALQSIGFMAFFLGLFAGPWWASIIIFG